MAGTTSRILITGASGMLAHGFQRLIASRHEDCVAVGRSHCDVADRRQLEIIFAQHQPTLVINCAAYTKVDLAEKEPQLADAVNAVAPGYLAELCRQHAAKLVHFSTDYVFDGTLRRPLRPDDPVGPESAYGRSKLLGEQAIQRAAELHYLIIRTAWLYGPNGASFPQTMINLARQGKPLNVVDDQVGSPTFTYDLAEATWNLIDVNARGIFHVTNSGQTTWYHFAAAIFEEFELSANLSRTTSDQWKKLRPESATRPAYSVLDTSEYTRVTGKPMRSWREALRAYRLTLSHERQAS